MGLINLKKSLQNQASVQTTEVVGIYDVTKYRNYGYAGNAEVPVRTQFVQEGFLVYDYLPIIGGSAQLNKNYFTRAALNEFVATRGKNVSLNSYNPADVGKWLVASGGINILAAEIKRALKANYLPKDKEGQQEMKAGLTTVPSKILSNKIGNSEIANYIERYNQAVALIQGIRVPKNVNIIDYWFKLSSCMYKEDSVQRGQTFMFRAGAIPYWDVNGRFGDAGNIVWRMLGAGLNQGQNGDLDTMLTLFEDCINTYVTDSTCANMFAEFTHADNSDSYAIEVITLDEVKKGIEVRTDMDVLASIKNANILPIAYSDIQDFNIHQITTPSGTYALEYGSSENEHGLSYANNNTGFTFDVDASEMTSYANYDFAMKLYNCHKDVMSENENANALQFTAITTLHGAGVNSVYSAGAVVLIGLHSFTAEVGNGVKPGFNLYCNNITFSTNKNRGQVYDALLQDGASPGNAALLQFTAIPSIQFCIANTTSGFRSNFIVDDCDNVQSISYDVIDKVFNAINESLIAKE